jgi:hypothetical protein
MPQVPLAEHNDMVETFPADRTDSTTWLCATFLRLSSLASGWNLTLGALV